MESIFQRRIRRHVVGREHAFSAVVQPGFEETAKRELLSLGVDSAAVAREGGVDFRGKLPVCYMVNYRSRTVTRVLMRLFSFRAANFDLFRDKIGAFPWELYLGRAISMDFSIHSSGSRLYHTGRIEEECRNGIAGRLGQQGLGIATGEDSPRQKIFVRLEHDRCAVSLDSSGDLLYRRGEKQLVTAAPLRETLAALILTEARIDEYDVLLDPMCGSGTFSLEGAGIKLRRPPGENRDFIFMKWPAFGAPAFNHMKKIAGVAMADRAEELSAGVPIVYASDSDPSAVKAARKNLEQAGLGKAADVGLRDFLKEPVPLPPGKRCLMAVNPPYGQRLGRDIRGLYRALGESVRRWYGDCGYAIITPSLEHEKILSLGYDRKIPFFHGGIGVAVIIKDAPGRP